MTTDKYINSKAEQQHMSDQLGYVDGLTHGLDIAVGFYEWVEEGRWFHDNIEQREHSTEELLCYYLDTLKTK